MMDHEWSPFSLKGEIALVTGGGTGLGLAMTKCLLAAGARVAIVGRRQTVLDEAVAALGSQVTSIVGDVNDLESAPALIRKVQERVGPPTILVNNAGIQLKKPALVTTDQEFANVMHTHVAASFALARESAKVMLPPTKAALFSLVRWRA